MLHEIHIRAHTEYAEGKYHGYVDIGAGHKDDGKEAKEALVFMAVSINETWKIPLGYFLIDGLSGEERANLVEECLTRLHEIGTPGESLTCDGPPCHFSMLRALGAKLGLDDLDPSFLHPADPTKKVHVLLDACHMVKLLRNSFGDGLVFFTTQGETIRWQYIDELVKLQVLYHNSID